MQRYVYIDAAGLQKSRRLMWVQTGMCGHKHLVVNPGEDLDYTTRMWLDVFCSSSIKPNLSRCPRQPGTNDNTATAQLVFDYSATVPRQRWTCVQQDFV